MADLVSGNFFNTAQNMSSDQAKQLVTNALANANTYLQGMKTMAGGTEGVPMKTMKKDQQDWEQLTSYYNQQGQVGPKTSTDPSADIRALGQAWGKTSDPAQRNKYHQMALDLATKAGWLMPGETVDSVSSMPQMSAAGMPNYESEMDKLALALKASGGGGGGAGGGTIKKSDAATAGAKMQIQDKILQLQGIYAPDNPEFLNQVKTAIAIAEPTWQTEGVDVNEVYDYAYSAFGYKDRAAYDKEQIAKQSK